MSFTAQVREELAHAPLGETCCRAAETAAIARLGGALQVSGAGPGWVVDITVGAVARRLHSAFVDLYEVRAEIEVHQPTGLQPTRYRLVLAGPSRDVLQRMGLFDDEGRPAERPPARLLMTAHDAAAYVRGALMVAASVSDPRRGAHLEIRTPSRQSATTVVQLLHRCGAAGARAAQRDDGWRVVVKNGEEIGAVLARTGAHTSFLHWDAERLRRELRGEANRAANADRANLGRAAGAAARQVADIEAAVARLGWDALPDDLRETALARLANPEASLAELAALHDPPVGKATVHRRLLRIADLDG
ncbi:MAG TPA: DNA-binding protein WhiA [Egibacteraceae bacterium]|nr:DNA-binding protein WhiA [Egibacteraceae bacterium]